MFNQFPYDLSAAALEGFGVGVWEDKTGKTVWLERVEDGFAAALSDAKGLIVGARWTRNGERFDLARAWGPGTEAMAKAGLTTEQMSSRVMMALGASALKMDSSALMDEQEARAMREEGLERKGEDKTRAEPAPWDKLEKARSLAHALEPASSSASESKARGAKHG